MGAFAVINPATGETLAEYPAASDAEVEAGIAAADHTYRSWARTTTLEERTAAAARLAELFDERAEEFAEIINREMGKPFAQGVGETRFSGSITSAYARKAADWLADDVLDVDDGLRTFVRYQGIGVLLGVMPWNFPVYQVVRFAVPNLILGNTVLLRHASQCPESALALERIFRDAGFPEGAYVNLFATHDQIADIIADDRVQGVSLTGSERAGAAVAAQAGKHLKKCVLELGGADVFLVLDTDDLDHAVEHAVRGRMDNSGQSCTGSKRIVVLEKYFDEFSEKFARALSAQTYAAGDFGPLSSSAATRELAELVTGAVDQGAEILVGDGDPEGNVFTPTILTGITPAMDVYSQELFGPVAQLYRVSSDAEAVELANSSPFGLGSVIICDDLERAERVGSQLDVGMVFIGAAGLSGADVPFGGVKKSGYGREMGQAGLLEFANKKLFRFAGAAGR
ncbi:aldehyde dehydrogenase family protein [Leucobacter chromiiresistens]|uniref:Succinate-semialdehyde dehydrogenase / glutarate-semialdehyde dehydrogenase n=1 Tax=Leucobacter chromiiresistens TaxID=1079994 RepID=A0A1H0Y238_9MICO|nr:aldehyde dehydrogenase family protein [Leucobacter chromiiresistens]SDQ09121.1 succinate-semialdehyde dehydrogenase / glutarate-semialdehyde dehydrogenase [Leucobacter chromiiresistens]